MKINGITHKSVRRLLYLALVLFYSSMIMPSVTIGWLDGNSTLLGFQAVYGSVFYSLSARAYFLHPGLWFLGLIKLPMFFTNVGMVFAPFLFRPSYQKWQKYFKYLFMYFTISVWAGPFSSEFPRVHIGYYPWALSITLITVLLWIRNITLEQLTTQEASKC